MLVVGGGPAGAGLAIALAEAGGAVTLVERESGPHDKVCGEFLSGEALDDLSRLGVDPFALGAVPLDRVVLSRGAISVSRPLPFRAASLSRRRLDEALLARAEQAGAAVLRGRAVRALRRSGCGWTARLEDGEDIAARDAALATGKHDLRGFSRPEGRQNGLIGLKTHFRLAPGARASLERTVVLGLFPGGYAGLEPIEDGLANLCLVIDANAYARLGRDWPTLVGVVGAAAPEIGARLVGADQLNSRPLAIARIPYGLVLGSGDSSWRLGDQAAVIPSFAGEGMSIALHGARRAAAAYCAGEPSSVFQRRLAAEVGGQIRLATLVSRMLVDGRGQAAAAGLSRSFPRTLSTIASATRLRRPAGRRPLPAKARPVEA